MDNPLKYSDLLQPDDSIEKAIGQLEQLNKAYSEFIKAIQSEAARLQTTMKGLSGSTEQYRAALQEAAAQADRLSTAYDELAGAQASVQSAIDGMRQKQQAATQAAGSAATAARAEAKSYEDLEGSINATMGTRQENIKRMVEEQAAIREINARLKELRKQQDDTGSSAAASQIAKLTDELLTHKAALSELQQSLNNAAKMENAAATSMTALSQELGRMRTAYRSLTAEERQSPFGQELLASIQKADAEIKELDATIGNHQRNVGNYASGWNGLGNAIQQVGRELPSLAVGWNTFFLAISNNLPILADEISRARKEYEAAKKSGQSATPVWKQILSSIVSWQTALTVGITLLAVYGGKIVDWAKNLVKGKEAAMSLHEATDNINEALEKNAGTYGDNILKFKQLKEEYEKLRAEAEKTRWIKEHQKDFDGLKIAVKNVNDAENAFINGTQNVVDAFKLRAKAAAAETLAAEKYKEALVARSKAEAQQKELDDNGPSFWDKAKAPLYGGGETTYTSNGVPVSIGVDYKQAAIDAAKAAITGLEEEATAAETAADAYFDLAAGYKQAAKERLDEAGIDESNGGSGANAAAKKIKDLTDAINKNSIEARKKYEESVTALTADEYAKRRKELDDQTKNENAQLRDRLRLNESYIKNVDGKYKKLTADQVKQIEEQNELIAKTIGNNLKALEIELQKLKNEQAVSSLQVQRNAISQTDTSRMEAAAKNDETVVTTNIVVTRDISQMEESLVEERKLMEESLELEYGLALDTNRKLLEAGDAEARSEEEILTELNKKRMDLFAEYDKQILEARERDIEAQLELVKKGGEEELELLLKQNEIRRQLALANNAAAPASEQASSSVINASYAKQDGLIRGKAEYEALQQQQKLDELVFNEVRRSEQEISNFKLLQERERWQKQIALAESGMLDWSDTQIAIAKKTVEAINKELSDVGVGVDVKSTDSDLSGGFKGFLSSVGQNGLGNSLLEKLGLDSDSIKALGEAADIVVDNLQEIMEAYVELAEAAVEAAEERVDSAQSAYDAEVEARNNGYANNVVTAAKELALEQANLKKQQQQLEEAQRQQEAVDTALQASSLITAVANIWATFTKLGPWGIAAAAAATAAMFASFAAAKIKARQVTAMTQTEEYGEGGLEFLSGGSHASGHDIDLGVKNRKGRQMHAEGGEALAVINKKRTKKYRRSLPEIIASLNDGTFEKKFVSMNAMRGETDGAASGRLDFWDGMFMRAMQATPGFAAKAAARRPFDGMPQSFGAFPQGDGAIRVNVTEPSRNAAGIKRLEGDVRKIREQNETKYYTLPDGSAVIQRKNVKRIIRKH